MITEIKEALLALENERGRLTPEIVLDAAKDATSPLHGSFEWNDDKAAHDHRLEQARQLIRGVKVEITTSVRTVYAPTYVRDPEAEGSGAQGYVNISQLQREPVNAAQLVSHEFDRALACLRRAEVLAEALGMSERVKRTYKSVERLKEEVQELNV